MKGIFAFVAVFFALAIAPFAYASTINIVDESISVHLQDYGSFVVVDDISLRHVGEADSYFAKSLPSDVGHIEQLSVTDFSGSSLDFQQDGRLLRIFDQPKEVRLRYVVKQGIDYYKNFDQLHVSFAQESRPYGIENLSVAVHFPEGKVVHESFLEQSIISPTLSTSSEYVDSVARFEAKDIAPFQDFAVILQWPRGIIQAPIGESLGAKYFYIFLLIITPLLTLLLVAYTVWQHRKIQQFQSGTSPVQSEPLEVSPAMAAYVMKEQYSGRSLPAEIFELVRQGYIRIHARFEKGVFKSSYVYKFEQVHVNYHNLESYQKMIMELFFQKGRLVLFSEAASHKRQLQEVLANLISSQAREDGYISRNPQKMRMQYILYLAVFSALLFVISLLIPLKTQAHILSVESLLLFVVGVLMCLYIPSKTIKGMLLSKEAMSVSGYIRSRALEKLNGDHMTAMLPLAIALKCEKLWMADFANAHDLNLRWYAGKDEARFDSVSQLVELFS